MNILSGDPRVLEEEEELIDYEEKYEKFEKYEVEEAEGGFLSEIKSFEKMNKNFVFEVENMEEEDRMDLERIEEEFREKTGKKKVDIDEIIKKQPVKKEIQKKEEKKPFKGEKKDKIDRLEEVDYVGSVISKKKRELRDKKRKKEDFFEMDMEEELNEEEKEEFFDKDVVDIEEEDMREFSEFNLSRPILKALESMGFNKPTPVQSKTIPIALLGKDIVGSAVTGSGKTGAFLIPIIERLLYRPKKIAITRVLILCPTRELAIQCYNTAKKMVYYTDIKICICTGGLSLKIQEAELRKRPDIVIATPGRFIDHVRNSYGFSPEGIEIIVIDEADRILEEGFQEELDEIVRICPKSRQTILFSATMTDKVDQLVRLLLNKPVRLFIDPKNSTAKSLVQEFIRIRPHKNHLRTAILVYLCSNIFKTKTIIFFRNKSFTHRMRIVFTLLHLNARELHGNLSQEQRIESLESFRQGKIDFLLATDLASRGLDIKKVNYIINYETPQSFDTYLHRIGRTARAGCNGIAITLVGEEDRKIMKIAMKIGQKYENILRNRAIPWDLIDTYHTKLQNLESTIQNILIEEKQEKQLLQAEMELKKSQNLIKFNEEIKSRLPRTWFLTKNKKENTKS
ncbi:hypothetical protein T552_00157 [Pneumocystis carinii B80]|uniref:RNA helicase n=1 Tax=Pneumocystis carinii (strain B80) TaxID=1408658 RepID=A0A0W4ZT03_PNEC8|nr:hypothetical protein T552_00157 [Pneumocystis carinii B80]KTW31515.1 hypothetical protein T552_00157 [Pneumocystis carinii B80]